MNLEFTERMKKDSYYAILAINKMPIVSIGSPVAKPLRMCAAWTDILLTQYIFLTRENIELRKELQKTQDRSDRMEAVLDRMPVSWDDLGIDEIDDDTGEPIDEPDAWSEEQKEFFEYVEKFLDMENYW